jgi:SAM-dependent methyltransferase
VVELTQPSKARSTLLDVGSGTGTLAATLARKGYTVYGMDKSEVMVQHAESAHGDIPTIRFKRGDWTDSMLWESGSFSHVLCTGFTLYTTDVAGQQRLLKNCHHWLKPGGYLVLQLADAAKFSAIVPGGRPPIPVESRERITNTVIDFVDFEYKASYKFPGTGLATLTETFVDGLSKNVCELEQTFYMTSVQDVMAMAVKAGFAGQGYVALAHDPHQYLCVFVK